MSASARVKGRPRDNGLVDRQGRYQHTGVVANLKFAASVAVAVSEYSKVETLEGAERYGLDDRGREDGDQEQAKGHEQQHR